MFFNRNSCLAALLLASSLTLSTGAHCADAENAEERSTAAFNAHIVAVNLPAVDAIQTVQDNRSSDSSTSVPVADADQSTSTISAPKPGGTSSGAASSVAQATSTPAAGFLGTPTIIPASDCIFVDNDDEKAAAQIQETFKWQELPDSPGKTRLSTGAQFPVKVVSQLNSKSAKVGDPVEGLVRVDVRIGGRLVAPKGTRVVGHVFNVMPARRMLMAEMSRKRWFRANGEIGIEFDEMITSAGEHLPLVAKPAQMSRIVDNKNEGRVMGVNAKGEVASPLSIQLKHQALHLAIRAGAAGAGVFSFGAVPVAYAAVGALNPSFAFLHPVGKNVPHRRLKGAAMGFVSGVPGGFLIADSIIKGVEASIVPGDEFLVEFKQDFTGEPATDAEMMANGRKDVHGEVVHQNKKKRNRQGQ